MRILSIDPGPTNTAVLVWNTGTETIEYKGKIPTPEALVIVQTTTADIVYCELLQCMGMAVGREVFETAYYIGEIRRICIDRGLKFKGVFRTEIKLHHCHTTKAKDGNIRQALLDRYADRRDKQGRLSGGSKKDPGRLFGVSEDIWSALAIATYAADKLRNTKVELT